jgi:hypothetical protein
MEVVMDNRKKIPWALAAITGVALLTASFSAMAQDGGDNGRASGSGFQNNNGMDSNPADSNNRSTSRRNSDTGTNETTSGQSQFYNSSSSYNDNRYGQTSADRGALTQDQRKNLLQERERSRTDGSPEGSGLAAAEQGMK